MLAGDANSPGGADRARRRTGATDNAKIRGLAGGLRTLAGSGSCGGKSRVRETPTLRASLASRSGLHAFAALLLRAAGSGCGGGSGDGTSRVRETPTLRANLASSSGLHAFAALLLRLGADEERRPLSWSQPSPGGPASTSAVKRWPARTDAGTRTSYSPPSGARATTSRLGGRLEGHMTRMRRGAPALIRTPQGKAPPQAQQPSTPLAAAAVGQRAAGLSRSGADPVT
jgi:hypothetical protein